MTVSQKFKGGFNRSVTLQEGEVRIVSDRQRSSGTKLAIYFNTYGIWAQSLYLIMNFWINSKFNNPASSASRQLSRLLLQDHSFRGHNLSIDHQSVIIGAGRKITRLQVHVSLAR